jgi:hypothetical protein
MGISTQLVTHNLDFTKQFSIVKNKQKNEVKKKEKRLLMLLIAFNAFRQAETCTGQGIQRAFKDNPFVIQRQSLCHSKTIPLSFKDNPFALSDIYHY